MTTELNKDFSKALETISNAKYKELGTYAYTSGYFSVLCYELFQFLPKKLQEQYVKDLQEAAEMMVESSKKVESSEI
jgi:hypothetical protein